MHYAGTRIRIIGACFRRAGRKKLQKHDKQGLDEHGGVHDVQGLDVLLVPAETDQVLRGQAELGLDVWFLTQ